MFGMDREMQNEHGHAELTWKRIIEIGNLYKAKNSKND
jgi:hypothetical protein